MSQGQSDADLTAERFGDFVLTRQLAVEQNAIIYRARKFDAPAVEKSEKYVVVICPGSPAGSASIPSIGAEAPTLENDLQLSFLEVVKQQKKAHESGAPNIVPVLDFGITSKGAWYATDYYPRGFLKKWITQRAGVSEEELRQIIASTVQCLLGLKQYCHRTHGNLTAASILIGGKAGMPLRAAPIFLTYLKPGEAKDADRYELSDLRSLGLIVFQLVCRQDLQIFPSDNYPIPASEYWAQLGKTADEWRGLCNRLLDPELTLAKYSLEKFASELPAKQPAPSFAPWIAVAALVCVVAGGFIWWRMKSPSPETQQKESGLAVGISNTLAEVPSNSVAVIPQKEEVQTAIVPKAVITNTAPIPPAEEANESSLAIIGIDDQSVNLGIPTARYPFSLGVGEQTAQKLFVASASSQPSYLPDSSLKIEGTGNKRVLVVDPVPQQTGEVILAVSAVGAHTNVTRTFWFKVLPPKGTP